MSSNDTQQQTHPEEFSEETPISKIEEKVEAYQLDLDSPIGTCRRATKEIKELLLNEIDSLEESDIERVQSHFRGENGTAEHFYLKVNAGPYHQPVIVDPTVDQFTKTNWISGKADTFIQDPLIPDIGLITPQQGNEQYPDTIYHRYV